MSIFFPKLVRQKYVHGREYVHAPLINYLVNYSNLWIYDLICFTLYVVQHSWDVCDPMSVPLF